DPEVIEEAAIRQTAHLRTYQIGEHASACSKLLNEIAEARALLLDPKKRSRLALPKPVAVGKWSDWRIGAATMVGAVAVAVGILLIFGRMPMQGSTRPEASGIVRPVKADDVPMGKTDFGARPS